MSPKHVIGDQFHSMPLTPLSIGMTAELSHMIQTDEIERFATVTGDVNPVHMSDAHARAEGFPCRIAHGMFVGSLISRLLSSSLPGPGTIYLAQSLRFHRPVMADDVVVVSVRIISISADMREIGLACHCRVGDNTVAEGACTVRVPLTGADSEKTPIVS